MKKTVHLACLLIGQCFITSNCFSQQAITDEQRSTTSTIVEQKKKEPVVLPQGVSQDWYKKSAELISKREYYFRQSGAKGHYVTASSKQNLAFRLSPDAYSIINIDQGKKTLQWQTNFQFKGIGRTDGSVGAETLQQFTSNENLLEYHYNTYTIQYFNDSRGLRQNFIVNQRPTGEGNLEVSMKLSGDLKAKVDNQNTLALSSPENENDIKLFYDQIKVWDANGKSLYARMELRHDNDLKIIVSDINATYPITIDPLNHAPDWTDNGEGLIFPVLNDLTVPLLYGYSVSGAGDVNGDGYDDVIIGAPAYVDIINIVGGTFNAASVGAAFIYYGSASGLSATPNEVLQPTSFAGALFGFSVSAAGDVNGDGRADVVVGAPGDQVSLSLISSLLPINTNVAVGKVYVYYGTQFDGNVNTQPAPGASLSLNQKDFSLLNLPLLNAPVNALYGFSVSNAGDVNGDGKSDIIVGSPAYTDLLSLTLAGRVDIFHGSASGINTTPSRSIGGGLLNGLFGYSVSTAGDVNGDGKGDVIVGAPASINLLGVGAAYVFHGSSSGITVSNTLSADAMLKAPGLLNQTLFGYSVSAAGDVNGDGKGDVIVGEPLALDLFNNSAVAVGKAHIYYGSNSGVQNNNGVELTSPRKPGLLGLITGNLLFGFSVSGVKDMNCDGVDDVIVGEPGGTAINLGTGLLNIVSTNALSGQAYIFYGKKTSGPSDNAGYTFTYQGSALTAANLLGYSVKGAGDINKDGKPDIIIGAPNGTLDLSAPLINTLGNLLGSTIKYVNNSVGGAYGYNGCFNAAPVAVNDNVTTNEDTPATVNVVANDTDGDGTVNKATVDLDISTAGIQNTFTNTYGSWSVNASGVVTYTPTLNFNGTATASYTVSDNAGAISNVATITVTVNSVNDAPVAVNDNTTTNKNSSITVNVVSNDTDVDGTINKATVDLNSSTTGIQNTVTNTYGTWSVDANGVVTFVPTSNITGTATVSYVVSDNNGAVSNSATITVTVNNTNTTPVANNDNVTTNEDTPLTINVVANDVYVDKTKVDLDPSAAGIQKTFTNTYGTWSVDANGVVIFTPSSNFNGTATASYVVSSSDGTVSNAATISVTVNSVNDAPVAKNDNVTTNEDTPLTINVVVNDTDVDGTVNKATVDLDPSTTGIQNTFTNTYGTWSVNTNGIVSYTPTLNFNGTATANYVVSDNNSTVSNVATITVTVNSVNDAPIANSDNVSTNEDVAVTVNVVTNDTDVDGTVNKATVDLDPSTTGIQNTFTNSSGTWSVDANGIVSYTPVLNFNGTATTGYVVNDNNSAVSNVAIITVTVASVNDAPVANNDNATTQENTLVTINVVTNDTDVDGTINKTTVDLNTSTTGVQNTVTNTYGTWSVDANGVVTFTPSSNFNGTATASYVVSDNQGAISNVGKITVQVKVNITTGLAKTVIDTATLADGTMQATFVFTVKSMGTGNINNIQVIDDLGSAFPAPTTVAVVKGEATGSLIFNTSYDGISNKNLLAQNSSIMAGDTQQVKLTIVVNAHGVPKIFMNSASVVVKSDDGLTTFTDVSTDGTNPDPNNNGNPSDTGEDASTPFNFPVRSGINVGETIATNPIWGSDCSYNVTLVVPMKNTGNIKFVDLKVDDNIEQSISLPSVFSIIDLVSNQLSVNTSFDGKSKTDLLVTGNSLQPSDSAEVSFTLNIVPNGFYGPYTTSVKVQATDANGGVILYPSVPVTFSITPQQLFIPEGFSPNNDGNHDKFEMTLTCGITAKLIVFNRWGEKVYQSDNYCNEWDGSSNCGTSAGKPLPEGTYFYKCELSSGHKVTKSITIKR